MHEELGRHDVQLLGDVLADAHHRLTTLAGGVLWLVVIVHPPQMIGQHLAPGFALDLLVGRCRCLVVLCLQRLQLRLQAGLVFSQRLLEHLPLLGVHAFGLGTEAPGLQACQLERDALDLDVLELDGLRLLGDLLALCSDAREHLLGHRRDCLRAQTTQVQGSERMQMGHARIVRISCSPDHPYICQLPRGSEAIPITYA